MRDALNRQARLELAWADRGGRQCLRVEGWTGAELRVLAALDRSELTCRLRVLPAELAESDDDLEALQPVAGSFAIDGSAVYFMPRFPFREGMRYALIADLDNAPRCSRKKRISTLDYPAAPGSPTTEVLAIYPSAAEVPVNLLRLYVCFSDPMSEDQAARAVHVHRADTGEPLADVFLRRPELWDRERCRLTLLLDPGRIKRGLVPNQIAGYPLIEGVPITIKIDAGFRDANGFPLVHSAERHYNVGPAVRAQIDPEQWQRIDPVARSTGALRVRFERPLDHGLVERCLWIVDATGRMLAGRSSLSLGEQTWWFEPEAPWNPGRHSIVVDPRLEDLAGNSVARVFDRDLTRAEDAPRQLAFVSLDFTCRASPIAPRR